MAATPDAHPTLSGLGGLVLVYLISYIISRLVTRPVEMLREGVSHIAAGDLDHRVKNPIS